MDVDYFQEMEGELVKIGDGSANESTIINLRSMMNYQKIRPCQILIYYTCATAFKG